MSKRLNEMRSFLNRVDKAVEAYLIGTTEDTDEKGIEGLDDQSKIRIEVEVLNQPRASIEFPLQPDILQAIDYMIQDQIKEWEEYEAESDDVSTEYLTEEQIIRYMCDKLDFDVEPIQSVEPVTSDKPHIALWLIDGDTYMSLREMEEHVVRTILDNYFQAEFE